MQPPDPLATHAPVLAHTLVAAHPERVAELARLYAALEAAIIAAGKDGAAARAAHRALCARLIDWHRVDMEAERRDVVAIDAAERDEMRRTVRRAIAHVHSYHQGSRPTARERDVVQSLQRFDESFPAALPRADLVRFRRSAARLAALEQRNAWVAILGNEAGLLLAALEAGTDPIPPPDPDFEPGDDFRATFGWGLDTCVLRAPGATGGVDLGLGASPVVAAVLDVAGDDLHQVNERWIQLAAAAHPFARYPYVPRGRFCSIGPAAPLRGDLEEAGPIGWAAGDDVAALARDLAAVAGEQPAFAAELRAAADRVAGAARRGHAVIGLIEHLSREAEGQRTWFVHE